MTLPLRRWLAWIPFRMLWGYVILTAFLLPWLTRKTPKPGEWYPFSNFPMYSSFEDTAYYVYVTDLEDRPVPMAPVFNNWPSGVKKAYDQKLKAEVKRLKAVAQDQGGKYRKRIFEMSGEECRPAGDATLRQLKESSQNPQEMQKYSGFRLYQMDILLEDGQIVKKPKLVGEIR